MSPMPLGRRVIEPPIPPIAEHTTRFPAGSVTFGVEYRLLDVPVPEVWEPADENAKFVDQGVTIHVWDTATDAEYLRFDCFADTPHYHYSDPATGDYLVVPFDAFANGDDMLGWTLERLRTRLPAMLSNTGGAHLSPTIDAASLSPALTAVEDAVRRASLQEAQ